MEVIKEILSDKVDYLNALKNAPEVPIAPPPVIEVVESAIHTPIIPEISPPPPVIAVPQSKKGFTIWHLLWGIAVVGVAVYAIKKFNAKKEKEQENFNGRR